MKRRSKYRKHVEAALLDGFPEPKETEEVVVVIASRGGNVLQVKPIPVNLKTKTTQPLAEIVEVVKDDPASQECQVVDTEKNQEELNTEEKNKNKNKNKNKEKTEKEKKKEREMEEDEVTLCLLPAKFRKVVWVRRGTLLIVTKAEDDYITAKKKKGKVKYTVNHILFHKQVKHLIEENIITQASINLLMDPVQMSSSISTEDVAEKKEIDAAGAVETDKTQIVEEGQYADEDDDSMDDVFVNNNRRGYALESDSEEDSEEDSEKEEGEKS